ncbi:MAG TPA: hypothetical protein VG013_22310 [Gemmataceae bacterium]|nr:hypothetical protein [Gemmataceae bacterium]
MSTTTKPDPAARLKLAREALDSYREWDASPTCPDGWPVVLGKLASSLELLVEVIDG